MRKLLLSGLVISGLIFVSPTAALACAQGKSQCSKCAEKVKTCMILKLKKKVRPLWENKEDLNIKDEQLDKIKDIKHAAIKELIRLKADKEIVMVDLKSAMYADTIDVSAVNKLLDAKYDAKKSTAKTFIKAVSDIQQVLSEDQREQWKDLIKESKSKPFCTKCGVFGHICPLAGKGSGRK